MFNGFAIKWKRFSHQFFARELISQFGSTPGEADGLLNWRPGDILAT